MDAASRDLAEMVIDTGRRIRHLQQAAVPLAEVRPDPLADVCARKALEAEADGAWLLRAGVADGYQSLLRSSGLDAAARMLRRQPVEG